MNNSNLNQQRFFTSTERYGGITKTKIHNCENVSSNDCYYEVVASYDAYDPYNKDGKFTDRFSLNNCDGTWKITRIKRLSKEHF